MSDAREMAMAMEVAIGAARGMLKTPLCRELVERAHLRGGMDAALREVDLLLADQQAGYAEIIAQFP